MVQRDRDKGKQMKDEGLPQKQALSPNFQNWVIDIIVNMVLKADIARKLQLDMLQNAQIYGVEICDFLKSLN